MHNVPRSLPATLLLAVALLLGAAPPLAVVHGDAAVPSGGTVLLDGSDSVSARPLAWKQLKGPTCLSVALDKGTTTAAALWLPKPPDGVYRFALVARGPINDADDQLVDVTVVDVTVGSAAPAPAPAPPALALVKPPAAPAAPVNRFGLADYAYAAAMHPKAMLPAGRWTAEARAMAAALRAQAAAPGRDPQAYLNGAVAAMRAAQGADTGVWAGFGKLLDDKLKALMGTGVITYTVADVAQVLSEIATGLEMIK